jgi:hypothetical protein
MAGRRAIERGVRSFVAEAQEPGALMPAAFMIGHHLSISAL